MFGSTIFLVAAALVAPLQVNAKVSTSPLAASRAPLPLTTSSNVLSLTRTKFGGGYNSRSAAALLGLAKRPSSKNTATLTSLELGQGFAAEITFGTETFLAFVDTGSADTWIVENGFQCLSLDSAPEPEGSCNFGPTYTLSKTFVQTPDENFNITYASGEFLNGIIGTEEVTLAGLKVKQIIAVVDYAAWLGDGTTSGLIGLAYPGITAAWAGTNPALDGTPTGEPVIYNPIFTTMVSDGLIPNLFSLAIERDISGPSGYLAFGGLPPVSFDGSFTSTPILVTTFLNFPVTYLFYTINIDSVLLHGKPAPGSGGPGVQYVYDSGTTQNYLPSSVSQAFNAAFDPPAVYNPDDGNYYVACNASKPALDIIIGGTKFDTNPLDLILLYGLDANGNDVCITGVTDGGSDASVDIYVLGAAFQKNVVSVFDVGAAELRLAAREHICFYMTLFR